MKLIGSSEETYIYFLNVLYRGFDMHDNFNLKNYVPIGETHRHFPISSKTLRNWRSAGKYPQLFATLGRKVFVDLKKLNELLCESQQQAMDRERELTKSLF